MTGRRVTTSAHPSELDHDEPGGVVAAEEAVPLWQRGVCHPILGRVAPGGPGDALTVFDASVLVDALVVARGSAFRAGAGGGVEDEFAGVVVEVEHRDE